MSKRAYKTLPAPKLVAVINTSMELVEVLEMALIDAGYRTVSLFTLQIKRDQVDLDDFLMKHQPDLVVYDIAIPYEENFELFVKLKSQCRNFAIPTLLTTTNKNVLEALVGPTGAFEVIGKPFDLNVLLYSIKEKLGDLSTDNPTIESGIGKGM